MEDRHGASCIRPNGSNGQVFWCRGCAPSVLRCTSEWWSCRSWMRGERTTCAGWRFSAHALGARSRWCSYASQRVVCLAPDYCNHTGKELPTNGIVLVVVPKMHTVNFSSHVHSVFILLRCTLLSYKDLLGTTFSPPPSYEIAYELPTATSPNIVDLFSGIGTWRLATLYLSEHRMICSVDIDRPSLLTQAQTFNLPLRTLIPSLYNITDCPFLLCHDLNDFSLLPLFALLSPTLFCASPPCPPWSHAGTQQGLNRADGTLTIFCLFYFLHVANTHGLGTSVRFLEHPHYVIFALLAQILGLTIKFKQSINAATHVPVSRNRVLLCCVPSRDTPRGCLPTWYSAECKPTLCPKHFLPLNSPHLNCPSFGLAQDELSTLCDFSLVPFWYPLPFAPFERQKK